MTSSENNTAESSGRPLNITGSFAKTVGLSPASLELHDPHRPGGAVYLSVYQGSQRLIVRAVGRFVPLVASRKLHRLTR